MVYGRKQACTLTHICNAVPLVWGLLRLASIRTFGKQLSGKNYRVDEKLGTLTDRYAIAVKKMAQ